MEEYYQCCHTRKCKWVGTKDELVEVPSTQWEDINAVDLVCPKCGNPEHYVIEEKEYERLKNKNLTCKEK